MEELEVKEEELVVEPYQMMEVEEGLGSRSSMQLEGIKVVMVEQLVLEKGKIYLIRQELLLGHVHLVLVVFL